MKATNPRISDAITAIVLLFSDRLKTNEERTALGTEIAKLINGIRKGEYETN